MVFLQGEHSWIDGVSKCELHSHRIANDVFFAEFVLIVYSFYNMEHRKILQICVLAFCSRCIQTMQEKHRHPSFFTNSSSSKER